MTPYKFNFPKNGLMAYDMANLILLLRIGVNKAYLSEEEQLEYLEQILHKIKQAYSSFKQFGIDAAIGRNIHIKYISIIRTGEITWEQKGALSIAFYSVWNKLQLIETALFD